MSTTRREDDVPQGLEGLNSSQREAVLHAEGSLLVLAGPGSGKTRVIAHRIARLLETGVPAGRILALTFTNKAAREMTSRVHALAGGRARGIWMSTFHSFSARLLRIESEPAGLSPRFVIYDADDSDRLLRNILKAEKVALGGTLSKGEIRSRISLLKNRLVPPGKAPARDGAEMLVKRLYELYQARLKKADAVDFDDLLFFAAGLLRKDRGVRQKYAERFLHVLVDEYQDTNAAQAEILKLLGGAHGNVCAVGDPDQSIYGWRGATVRNILDFSKHFPGATIVKLEQGYRSTKRILEAADGLIANNTERLERKLWTDNPAGPAVHVMRFEDRDEEASRIAAEIRALHGKGRRYADFAVLYRVNSYSRSFEQELVARKIPYALVGGVGFYERREVKDLLAYLRLVVNPADDLSFERIVNAPRRGIGEKAVETLRKEAAAAGKPLLEAVRLRLWEGKVRGPAAAGFDELARLYERFSGAALQPVVPLIETIFEGTRFLESLEEEDEDERMENVDELMDSAREYDDGEDAGDATTGRGLDGFLERVALVTDVDRWDDASDRVTLMTLHMAKGLEFPVVFIAGAQEGLIPFVRRSWDSWGDEPQPDLDPEKLEEERRLCFVGITRAKELAVLTHAMEGPPGSWDSAVPSRFLDELPAGAVRVVAPGESRSRRGKADSWLCLDPADEKPASRRGARRR